MNLMNATDYELFVFARFSTEINSLLLKFVKILNVFIKQAVIVFQIEPELTVEPVSFRLANCKQNELNGNTLNCDLDL